VCPRREYDAAELYVTTLEIVAYVRSDPAPGPALTRDPDDDYLIYLARAHDADFIVSGEVDLLEWHEQRPPVLTPAKFEAGWG